jgi:hypothetical protein
MQFIEFFWIGYIGSISPIFAINFFSNLIHCFSLLILIKFRTTFAKFLKLNSPYRLYPPASRPCTARPLLQPRLKGIAQRHQRIDLRNDAVLFS